MGKMSLTFAFTIAMLVALVVEMSAKGTSHTKVFLESGLMPSAIVLTDTIAQICICRLGVKMLELMQ